MPSRFTKQVNYSPVSVSSHSWLRGRLIPVALVLLATALTVPWTIWVIRTAYERHVLENAKMLARRVELRVSLVPSGAYSAQEAEKALQTELTSDVTVQMGVFCDLSTYP